MKVYLDNGATTKVDPEVVNAMKLYFLEKYGNASSLHSYGQQAKKALNNSRKVIAKIINADPEEIIFTSGGTESDNIALRGLADANKKKGNHIITSKIEHHAIIRTCQDLEKQGFKVTYLDVSEKGFVDPKDVEAAITKNTILVSIMHANNEIGTIQPISEIAAICREKGVYFHTDAVQSFTKVKIDVKKMNIDLASFSSHKIHGPKGVGAIYIKKGTKVNSLVTGGAHEFGKRAGTENVAGIVGFAKAASILNKDHLEKMTTLRDELINELLKIPHVQLNGSKQKRLCNNANLRFNLIEGEAMLIHLDMNGIAVSTGSACSSHELKVSHVLKAIGLSHDVAHGSIRFTLSKYTTKKEIDYTIDKVKEVVLKLRKISPLKPGYSAKDFPDHNH
ncbi:MAG: Cysteine desulfurase IscS 2 [Candidatus Woesearchaeota archaeon]|nr:Cysteine desulfurase IscS 2 [Candidatus Woesearchaeota archaeon]